MPRPIAYQRDEVLNAALGVFWTDGYEASSIQKLLKAMKLNRGSLYAGFTDKATLFREVMAVYAARVSELVEATLLAEPDPLRAVRRFFESAFLESDMAEMDRGCLLFNTVSELACTQPEMSECAVAYMDILRQSLVQRLQEARSQNRLRPGKSAEAYADYLLALVAGLRIQCKMGADRTIVADILDTGLRAIERED